MFNKLLKKIKEEKKSKTSNSLKTLEEDESLDLTETEFSKSQHQNLFSQKSKIPSIYYSPNFLTKKDQKTLTNFINKNKKKNTDLKKSRRKVQKWGGKVTSKGLQKQNLPKPLKNISNFFQKSKITKKATNHVLINKYEKDSGIMPHTDGPLYHPYTTVLSLGSSSVLEFYENYEFFKKKKIADSFLIEKGALYVFEGNAYKSFLHCIRDFAVDSVFLRISVFGEDFEILGSSVGNFFLTRVYEEIRKRKFRDLVREEVLVSFKGSGEFNYCMDLKRGERISLTFRFVPEILE